MWWTRTLICKTLLSPLSVRACLISAWGTNTFSRKWMWRPTEEGDNWDTWEPLCSDSEPPTPERKQTVAPLHREVRAPTDKVKCLSNRLSLNNQHRRLFWYKQQPIQFKHFGKYWAFSIWQRQRCEEPSVGFFFLATTKALPLSQHCVWILIELMRKSYPWKTHHLCN